MPSLSTQPTLGRKPSLGAPRPARTADLLQLSQGGNSYARSQLVTQNLGLIGSVINRKFESRDWEECWQVGAEGLLQAIDRWPGHGNWAKYAWSSIYYAILHYVTREPEPMASLDGEAYAIEDDRMRPDTLVIGEMVSAQTAALLAKLIAELPERDQIIVRLRYGFADGRTATYDEIGAAVGLDGSQARRRLLAIHKQLGRSEALRELASASREADSGA